ncbi:MAG: site-specific integrase [Planctomycetes bacterium]|nr:site-specific integrase [Planctomycetota bacterium]
MSRLSPYTPLLDFFEEWYRPRKLARKSESIVNPYRVSIRRFLRMMGREVKVIHLNEPNLRRFGDVLDAEGYSANTVAYYLHRIRSLWRLAAELGAAPPVTRGRLAPRCQPIFHPAEVWRPEHAEAQTLREFVFTVYLPERSVCDGWQSRLLSAVDLFSQWAGRPATLADFNRDTFNRFLADVAKHREPRTVWNKRTSLTSLWIRAYEDDLVPEPPKRIRKDKVPRKIPTAWTLEELRRIMEAAQESPGIVIGAQRQPSLRCHYYPALIRTGYDSGLRRGDLLALRRDQIDDSGTILVPLHKTGCDHICRVRPSTLRAIDALPAGGVIFPAPCHHEMKEAWEWILTTAGIPRNRWGQLQQLRRTSASHVEQRNPGSAGHHLGHLTPGLAEKSYIDPRVARADRPLPPDPFDGDDDDEDGQILGVVA